MLSSLGRGLSSGTNTAGAQVEKDRKAVTGLKYRRPPGTFAGVASVKWRKQ